MPSVAIAKACIAQELGIPDAWCCPFGITRIKDGNGGLKVTSVEGKAQVFKQGVGDVFCGGQLASVEEFQALPVQAANATLCLPPSQARAELQPLLTELPLPVLQQVLFHVLQACFELQSRCDFAPEAVEEAPGFVHGTGLSHLDWSGACFLVRFLIRLLPDESIALSSP